MSFSFSFVSERWYRRLRFILNREEEEITFGSFPIAAVVVVVVVVVVVTMDVGSKHRQDEVDDDNDEDVAF